MANSVGELLAQLRSGASPTLGNLPLGPQPGQVPMLPGLNRPPVMQGPPIPSAPAPQVDPTTGVQSAPQGANFIQRMANSVRHDPAVRRALQVGGFAKLGGADIGSAGLAGLQTFEKVREQQRSAQQQKIKDAAAGRAEEREERMLKGQETRVATEQERAREQARHNKEMEAIAKKQKGETPSSAQERILDIRARLVQKKAAEKGETLSLDEARMKALEEMERPSKAAVMYEARQLRREYLMKMGEPVSELDLKEAADAAARDYDQTFNATEAQGGNALLPPLAAEKIPQELQGTLTPIGDGSSVWVPVWLDSTSSFVDYQNSKSGEIQRKFVGDLQEAQRKRAAEVQAAEVQARQQERLATTPAAANVPSATPNQGGANAIGNAVMDLLK